jgi:hypothetical protein
VKDILLIAGQNFDDSCRWKATKLNKEKKLTKTGNREKQLQTTYKLICCHSLVKYAAVWAL